MEGDRIDKLPGFSLLVCTDVLWSLQTDVLRLPQPQTPKTPCAFGPLGKSMLLVWHCHVVQDGTGRAHCI